jgi:DNA-binding GntR family transcriptional regulator
MEVSLANQFGLSRTPLREALASLEREGFLVRRGRKGLTVPSLDTREVEEVCLTLGALEGFAVRSCGLPDDESLDDLEQLTDRICRETDGFRMLDLEDDWMSYLFEACSNRHLLRSVDGYRCKLRRYERAYVRDHDSTITTIMDHKLAFLFFCRMKNLTEAARRLEEHRLAYVHPMTTWLRSLRVGEMGHMAKTGPIWGPRAGRNHSQRAGSHG